MGLSQVMPKQIEANLYENVPAPKAWRDTSLHCLLLRADAITRSVENNYVNKQLLCVTNSLAESKLRNRR